MSDADLPPLARALLGHQPLDGLLAVHACGPEVTDALEQIRAGDPQAEWWGRNGERVDMTLRTGGDEWRVVYVSRDGQRVDEMAIFRQPPAFGGVAGGIAVIVNGPSGSGKSSVLEQIAARSALPWVVFDEPVMGAVAQGYLIWREQAEVVHAGFVDAIAALARRGNLVALSAAGHPQAMFDAAFAGVHVTRVGLHCDLDTLLAREQGRRGRWGGLAAASLNDNDGWTYDLSFDSVENGPQGIADHILATLPMTADPAADRPT